MDYGVCRTALNYRKKFLTHHSSLITQYHYSSLTAGLWIMDHGLCRTALIYRKKFLAHHSSLITQYHYSLLFLAFFFKLDVLTMKAKQTMKNIYIQLLTQLKAKQRVALGTIIGTKGHVRQVPGASAIFSGSKRLWGTLGGGLLEADAQKRANEAIKNKSSSVYDFDLTSESFIEDEAICGGKAKVLVDGAPELNLPSFQEAIKSFEKRTQGVLATKILASQGGHIHIQRIWVGKHTTELPPNFLESVYLEEAQRTLVDRKPRLIHLRQGISSDGHGENLLFLEPLYPQARLVIAGAGHIGQALAHLGHLLDFEVTVIDDRAEFANKERLPEADKIIIRDIGHTLREYSVGPDTYIVIVTRGHRNDADALRGCISSPAAYIGMIGSRKKIALMRDKFLAEGWASTAEWERVHAPIGLAINSKTVEEIAVSIAGQLIQTRSQRQPIVEDDS